MNYIAYKMIGELSKGSHGSGGGGGDEEDGARSCLIIVVFVLLVVALMIAIWKEGTTYTLLEETPSKRTTPEEK